LADSVDLGYTELVGVNLNSDRGKSKMISKKRVVITGAIFSLVLCLYQNCGPAKISGDAAQSLEMASTVGQTVDLAKLLQSSSEAASNVIFPAATVTPEYDYALNAPIFENLVLQKNDFSRIEWIHSPSATVISSGEAFNQKKFSSDLAGLYYVFGYRESTSYLISQFRLVDKGATSLNLNSVGAYQITQSAVSADAVNESILIQVDAPAVDLNSVQITLKNINQVFDGRRAVLVSKKINEAVDVEIHLTDLSGQSVTKLVTLPSKAAPPVVTTTTTTTTTLPPTTTTTTTSTTTTTLPGKDAFVAISAVNYTTQQGCIANSAGAMGYMDNGDWLRYAGLQFGSAGALGLVFNIGVQPTEAGQVIEVHLDSLTGPRIGSLTVQNTGSYATFTDQKIPLTKTTGLHDVYLVMVGASGVGDLRTLQFLKTTP
jgi:hypothetical protein